MSADQAVSVRHPTPDGGAAGELAAFFDQAWGRIISTQPARIRRHLAAERDLVDGLLSASGYRSLVEVGCADGSLLLPLAMRHGLAYTGLDLAAGAVAATRAALAGAPGVVVQANASDLDTLGLPLALPALVAFPFNVFGDLSAPHRTLAAAAALAADVLVLTYDTGEEAAATRSEYYHACGLTGRLRTDKTGVHLRSRPFTSSVYHPPVLTGWLAEHGYLVTTRRYGAVGLAYHGTRAPSRPTPVSA